MLVEYVRNVLGVAGAEHAETSPDAGNLVVTPLSCSLAGQEHSVRLLAGTRCAELYARDTAVERYYCSYGLSPEYREALEESGLRVGAVDDDGEVRAMELDGHPFLVGTLFLPQMRSRPGKPHPVLAGFAAAAAATS